MDTKELLLTTCMSDQYSVCLWDYSSANVIHQYKNGGHATSNSLAVLDRDYLLTAESNKPLLNIWMLNSHEPKKDLRLVLPGPATCLAVCPFSTYLAVGVGTKLYIWHISSGKLLTVQEKHYQPISVIKFSSDSIYVAVGGEDGSLVTYNFPHLIGFQNNLLTQNEAGQVEPLYSKSDHSRVITDMFVGVFGSKSRIATISSDQSCFIYTLNSGELLLSLVFPEELSAIAFSDTFWSTFVGTYSGNIIQIKLTDPPKTLNHHVDQTSSLNFVGHKNKITCLAVNFDNTILASGSADCMVYIWQIHSRKILKSIEQKGIVKNLLFVLNYDNFLSHTYKPDIVIKKLDRTLDHTDQYFDVCVNQNYDFEVKEEYLLEDKIETLLRENRYLRAANKQLYDANVYAISKRAKMSE